LFLVQDTSEDFEETWSFIERRLNDLTFIRSLGSQVQESSSMLSSLFAPAVIMAKNIVGINARR